MVRTLRGLAGAVFGLALAALVPFLIEKGAAPKGNAVLGILYILLGISFVVWLIASLAVWRDSYQRPRPLSIIYSLDGSPEMRIPFRLGRPQSVLLSVGLRNPNPFQQMQLSKSSREVQAWASPQRDQSPTRVFGWLSLAATWQR